MSIDYTILDRFVYSGRSELCKIGYVVKHTFWDRLPSHDCNIRALAQAIPA